MKGRTKCPECKHEFVLDLPIDGKKHEAVCPSCENKFIIRPPRKLTENGDECFWEEHGEPRKTVLSSKKPKTKKPRIAAILLICVFILGISTAMVSEKFIESSMDIASSIGITGDVEIHVTNQTNHSVNNIVISMEGVDDFKKTGNGSFLFKKVEVGIKKVKIISSEYNNITQEILVLPFIKTSKNIGVNKGTEKETNTYDESGCSIIIIIFSVFALIGAISSFKRAHYDVAVAGSIISIFSFGFFMVGSILAIIAFIIIFKTKEEFDNGKKGKTF